MLVNRGHLFEFERIWRETRLRLLFFASYAALVVIVDRVLNIDTGVPGPPVNILGAAVAFVIGFKSNQAYDRFWEARKVWGGIVNANRTWTATVIAYVTPGQEDSPAQQELVLRMVAWTNALRLHLRRQADWAAEVGPFLPPGELEHVMASANPPAQILAQQSRRLRDLVADGSIPTPWYQTQLQDIIRECYDHQGKCERIKNTPLPLQYTAACTLFVWVFILLMPVSVVDTFKDSLIWMAVPYSALICWTYDTMNRIGDMSENPFDNLPTDVPMSALSRSIEIDVRQALGERAVPPPLRPVDHVLN